MRERALVCCRSCVIHNNERGSLLKWILNAIFALAQWQIHLENNEIVLLKCVDKRKKKSETRRKSGDLFWWMETIYVSTECALDHFHLNYIKRFLLFLFSVQSWQTLTNCCSKTNSKWWKKNSLLTSCRFRICLELSNWAGVSRGGLSFFLRLPCVFFVVFQT